MTTRAPTSIRRRAPRARASAFAAGVAAVAILAGRSAAAVTHLQHGDVAPPIALETLDGVRATLEERRGHPVVVVFGEVYHQRTLEACREIRTVIESDALAGREITLLLVVAQNVSTAELRRRALDPRLPATILHDVDRAAYGTYRIAVMPSVVVVDAEGRVVHALAGYNARLADTVRDALQVAGGRMAYAQFEALLHPKATNVDEASVRAGRITRLARQLARRGLGALAEEEYREALQIAPGYAPARLGLAMTLLETQRLAQAEREFRSALEADPASLEAALGVAYVQTLRGGADLDAAVGILQGLLRTDPEEPRALYLLGLVHQQRGETDDAIAALRKSTELLMSRREGWHVIPSSPEAP